jgi:hypothetical protein
MPIPGFFLKMAYGMNMPLLEYHTGCEPGIPFYYTDLVEIFKVRWLTALPAWSEGQGMPPLLL